VRKFKKIFVFKKRHVGLILFLTKKGLMKISKKFTSIPAGGVYFIKSSPFFFP